MIDSSTSRILTDDKNLCKVLKALEKIESCFHGGKFKYLLSSDSKFLIKINSLKFKEAKQASQEKGHDVEGSFFSRIVTV